MDDALRVGIAVFNAGDSGVAADAWEAARPSLEDGTPDERLLGGLIGYATATDRARRRDWSAAEGPVKNAADCLADLDPDARGVNVSDIRAFCRRLAADPEFAERRRPPPLLIDGVALEPTDLAFGNVATAVTLLAAEYDAFAESVVADAVRYARAELDGGSDSETKDGTPRRQRRDPGFVGMLFDFAADRGRRSLVYDRLRAHVERRRSAERDASGLFE